jgi:hypothetical protein
MNWGRERDKLVVWMWKEATLFEKEDEEEEEKECERNEICYLEVKLLVPLKCNNFR